MAAEQNQLLACLHRSAQDRTLISVYNRQDDPDTFAVGWIVDVSGDTYVLASVDEFGRRDGVRVAFIEDIARIVEGGTYNDAIGRLMMNHLSSDPVDHPDWSVPGVLRWAQERRNVVTITDRLGVETHGYVTAVDKLSLQIRAYTKIGDDEGIYAILLSDLYRIEFGGPEQSRVQSLVG
jgi:hypothetical protein